MKRLIKAITASMLMSLSMASLAFATESEGGVVIINPGEEATAVDISVDEDQIIQEGIYFGNVSVGGMTVDEARKVIADYIAKVGEMNIRLSTETGYEELPVSELNPVCNNEEEMLATAVGVKHVGSLISQYKQAKDLECNSLYIDYDIAFSMDNVMDFLVEHSEAFETEPVNASVRLNENGSFTVIEAINGFTLDYDKTYDAIKEVIKNCDTSLEYLTCQVEGTTTEPQYGTEIFEGFGDLLGEASTEYRTTGDQKNRAINVRTAITRINGTVLYPGQQFSYCSAVQPFTTEAGYVLAGTYTATGVDDDLGGGICQVSTTLYDACLWSELQIDFRRPHSKTVDYVPYSMDAMVYVQDNQDYKFTNSTDHAIYIQYYYTTISDNKEKMTCKIYGTEYRPENRTIDYISYTDSTSTTDPPYLITYDEELDPFPTYEKDEPDYFYYIQAHIGAKSHLDKVVYVDGVVVSTTTISRDNYKPMQGVFTIHPDTTIKTLGLDEVLGIAGLQFYFPEELTTEEETTTEDETTTTDETTTPDETTTVPETTTTQAETTTVAETTTTAPVTEPATDPAEQVADTSAGE